MQRFDKMDTDYLHMPYHITNESINRRQLSLPSGKHCWWHKYSWSEYEYEISKSYSKCSNNIFKNRNNNLELEWKEWSSVSWTLRKDSGYTLIIAKPFKYIGVCFSYRIGVKVIENGIGSTRGGLAQRC